MILHRIQVWEGKKTRNKGKQAYFWDFLTIPGTSHLQVVLFSRTTLAPVLLDNSLKLKIRYSELMQSCPQAQKRWPRSSSPELFSPPPSQNPRGLTQHWVCRGCSTNTCWCIDPFHPRCGISLMTSLPSFTSIPVLAPFLFSTALQMQSSTWTTWWGYMTHFSS